MIKVKQEIFNELVKKKLIKFKKTKYSSCNFASTKNYKIVEINEDSKGIDEEGNIYYKDPILQYLHTVGLYER